MPTSRSSFLILIAGNSHSDCRAIGRPPESVFDFVQGITALARSKPHQDARLELEGRAAKLMASVG